MRKGLEFFLAYYREHKLDYTRVYDGVEEALTAIRDLQNGGPRKMAVLSNKPVNPSRAIVEAFGLGEFFASVYGGNSFASKKPDPEGAQTILRETSSRPEETLLVGDSAVDVLPAGMRAWTCGVTYGFAPAYPGRSTPGYRAGFAARIRRVIPAAVVR